MKNRIAFLLIVIGGVLWALGKSFISAVPSVFLSLLGGFLTGFSLLFFTGVYSGKVWGVQIRNTSGGRLMKICSAIGLVIGGFALVHTIVLLLVSLISFNFLTLIINLVICALSLAVGPFIAKRICENITKKEKNAEIIGQFDIFKEIDANLDQATNFVVGFEGVALYSKTNYCYAVYLYDNYQLGSLTTPEEVALVGIYFIQKYGDKFTFKVDVEVIPGEPGQTVVAVGAGGVQVARIQGTADQRLFRSYIFTRKD